MNARVEAWLKPVDAFARESLAERLRVMWEELERCAGDPGVDPVHDLRVSIRRFSQALRIFSALFGQRTARKIRKRLSAVLDAAAAVRDLDVGMERLKEEGLGEDSGIVGAMKRERVLKCYALLAEIYLLKAEDPLDAWREKLGLAR